MIPTRLTIGELDTLASNPIDVGGLDFGAIAADIRVTEVYQRASTGAQALKSTQDFTICDDH